MGIDPVEFLVQLRYPMETRLRLARKRAGIPYAPKVTDEDLQLYREIEQYRQQLQALKPDELQALFIEQRDKRAAELREKARRDDEHRFFNHPNNSADFNYWAKAEYWSLEEAVALSLGKNPHSVNRATLADFQSLNSPFAQEFFARLDLAERAANWKTLYNPVFPGIFLAWT